MTGPVCYIHSDTDIVPPPPMIKIDLHMHSGEDPHDGLRYPATALVDKAAALGFRAIAVTLHDKVLDDPRLYDYARERNVLLIPGVELRMQKVDVLLYNLTQAEADQIRSFDDLRRFRSRRGDEVLTVAPHPYFPVGHALKHHLERHIDLFDAIEHAQIHLPWLNFNKQARHIADYYQKPLIANSDAHNIWMFGRHYTRVDAPAEMPAIFEAIRQNRLEWISPPITLRECLRMFVVDTRRRARPGETVESFA